MIRFFVGGLPRAMSVGKSIRFRRGTGPIQHFQKRDNSDWALLVGQIGREHAPSAPYGPEIPLSFTACFVMPRPATLPKRVQLPLKRPDVDNLVHKLTDQWNGIFYADDSQIVDLVVRKRFAVDGRPGVEIIVAPVLVDVPDGPRVPVQGELTGSVR